MVVSPSLIVAHYDEIALKGANRRWFAERLARNMRETLDGCAVAAVEPVRGRIDIRVRPEVTDLDGVIRRLQHVFGIASLAPMWQVPMEPAALADAVLGLLPSTGPASFRVRVARGDKRYPVDSPTLERRVGARIHEALGWPVSLTTPALTVSIEIDRAGARCGVTRLSGPGGLPVGTAGRVLCLLSGGLDSALAAWRVMRRGCRVDVVHMHSAPLTSEASQHAARAASAFLARGQSQVRMTLVGIADLQKHVAAVAPASLRTVIYRRAMMRLADRLARQAGARALVTGEAIGQVASQTLENLATIDRVSTLPILRPLIAYDKRDVIDEARRWGMPATPMSDEEDCCRLFAPAAAAIRSGTDACIAIEREMPLAALLDAALEAAEKSIVLPAWPSPRSKE